MGKMTPEKAAKMLAKEGIVVTNEEATQIVDFLRTLAKMAVAHYLREDERPPLQNTVDNQEQILN